MEEETLGAARAKTPRLGKQWDWQQKNVDNLTCLLKFTLKKVVSYYMSEVLRLYFSALIIDAVVTEANLYATKF